MIFVGSQGMLLHQQRNTWQPVPKHLDRAGIQLRALFLRLPLGDSIVHVMPETVFQHLLAGDLRDMRVLHVDDQDSLGKAVD